MFTVENLNQLINLSGDEFVVQTFRAVLKRDPDAVEKSQCVAAVRGGADKWGFVVNVANSPEGLRNVVALPGLADALRWRRYELRRPFGPVYRLIRILKRLFHSLSRLESRLDRIEYTLKILEARVASGVPNAASELAEPLKEISSETFPTLTPLARKIIRRLGK